MNNIDDTRYKPLRDWVDMSRELGKSWDEISSKVQPGKTDVEFFESNIKHNYWPENSQQVWSDIVKSMHEIETRKDEIYKKAERATIRGRNQKNMLKVPNDKHSSWVLYRQRLEEKGFKNIDTIEAECLNVLENLNSDTKGEPVKGMVVGNVQSGKTANMTGLIAMAADHGWNMFIVLSGTIESLRNQTRTRMYNDLYGDLRNRGKLNWFGINHLSLKDPDNTPELADFSEGSANRYLTICLKVKSRLQEVLRWINKNPEKKKQMKILVIDDEADHASVNTASFDKNRKTINKLILNLIDGKPLRGKKTEDYASMNYVAYTATPYANFLSEGSEESLYPRNFITLLSPPDIYFGPKELYGYDDQPGINIINTYENTEVAIKKLHKGETEELTEGLKDAICWFICCVGVLKKQSYHEPVSMLIHTSFATDDHQYVANAVQSYLTEDKTDILKRCERVYSKQTSDFTKSQFESGYPNYGRIDEISDYPSFDEIYESVIKLIDEPTDHIKINEDAERVYHEGIHLCIDNSSGTTLGDEKNALPRLLYPEEGNKNVPKTPAFIVIGGNTLSRGLTVEGLVSTYFARPVTQADTLMQMGRWFGYRRGYELLPRLWMSENSKMSFEELVSLDVALRDFIKENYKIMTPGDFPPKVRKFPKSSYLKRVTSTNKMRGAIETDYEFDGTMVETTSFDKNSDYLQNNIRVTEDFIKSLDSKPEKSDYTEALVWRGINGETILNDFFNNFKFSEIQRNFNELNAMKVWIKNKTGSYDWNVILAGIKKSKYEPWSITEDISINKVERSSLYERDESVHIGSSLSSPKDRIADIRSDVLHKNAPSEDMYNAMLTSDCIRSNLRSIRKKGELDNTPALIIYCISKDAEPTSKNRFKLNVEEDIIGISVIMPGLKAAKGPEAKNLQLSPAFFKEI